jgi:hypothetical protein
MIWTVADPPVGDSATATPLEILYFHFSFTKMKKYGLYCLENRFFSMIATPSLIFWIRHWIWTMRTKIQA